MNKPNRPTARANATHSFGAAPKNPNRVVKTTGSGFHDGPPPTMKGSAGAMTW